MNERLEIDALRAMLAISAHGGVTRAAEHLALSQSAVSHKIRRLEQTLDCQLLARRSGGPLFTDAGERLLHYARRMTDLQDEALAALGRKSLSGTLRLGITEDAATSNLAGIMGRFTRLYPDVQVRVRTNQSLTVQSWLDAGDLDVAVIQIFRSDLRSDDLLLFGDSLHWVKSPDLDIDPTSPVPFLAFDTNCFYKNWGLTDGQSLGHQLNTVLECPSAAGIQSAVRAGLGVALLNRMHVTPDIDIIEATFPPPPPIAYIARLGSRRRNPAAAALIEEIRGEIGRSLHAAKPVR